MNLKKLLIPAFTLIFGSIAGLKAQGTVVTEGFENAGFPPAGWAAVGGGNLWSRVTAGTNPTVTPHGGSAMCQFAARRAFAAGQQQTVSSPLMDLSSRGTGNSYFSFYIYRDSLFTQDDSLTIYINTTRSLTGATRLGVVDRNCKQNIPDIVTQGWQKYSFAIPASFKGNTNYVLLTGTARSSGNVGANIFLDDFEWQHFPTWCSGKPTIGTLSASPTKICAAAGQVTLTLTGNTTDYGTSIQWQQATSATGTYTNTGTGANPFVTFINSNRYFRAIITCSKSGSVDTSKVISIMINAGTAPTLTVTPGFGTICPGGAGVKIAATATNNAKITWNPTTGLSSGSTADTTIANPSANTNYTVTATDSAGCIATRNVSVFLSAAPTVTLTFTDSNICAGDSMLVTASATSGGGPGAVTYLWNDGKTTATNYAHATGTTNYSVTAKNGAGCTATKGQNFHEVVKPTAKFTYVQNGFKFDFKNISTGGTSYHWIFGSGLESFTENPTFTFTTAGPQQVIFVVSSGKCGGDTFRQYVNPQPLTSVKNEQLAGVKIYPNPSDAQLNVFVPAMHGTAKLTVTGLQGQIIWVSEMKDPMNRESQIPTSMLKDGIYIVNIEAGKLKNTYKIMVKH